MSQADIEVLMSKNVPDVADCFKSQIRFLIDQSARSGNPGFSRQIRKKPVAEIE